MNQFDPNEPIGLPRVRIPNVSGRTVGRVAIALVVVIAALSSVYTIEPEEVGLVLLFGKYVRSADPGLHLKLPFGIERAIKVPVQRQLKHEFGFRTVRAGVRSEFTTQEHSGEANMLTGDLNAALVEWVVQYRIRDPFRYLFRVRNVSDTFRSMSEAVTRKIVGNRTVNEVLTVGRAEVALEIQLQLQALCDQYETGIVVDQVVLQDVNPPDAVKPSFNEVNEAQQEREKLINEAQSEYNKVIPRAKGEAQQIIQQAEGYKLDRVNRAEGDATHFTAAYDAYRSAPEITRQRIYLETMNSILPRVQRKIIVDNELRGILPLLNLSTGAPPQGGEAK
ncbi:MAG: FtsH protease activity modulator HflK [Candidatus Eisenbacteria bacterium]